MSAKPFKTQIIVSKQWTLDTDTSDHPFEIIPRPFDTFGLSTPLKHAFF